MTTPAAARLYEAQHLLEMEGKRFAVYNPHNKPLEKLPIIFGFNNGGGGSFFSAVAIAEDGTVLGGHLCSSEGYMPHDLGMLEGTRPDRHEGSYQKHYPEGYQMTFVPSEEINNTPKLLEAFRLNKEQAS
jgi:hypothetical protein